MVSYTMCMKYIYIDNAPFVTAAPVTIKKSPVDTHVNLYQSVNLTCEATGDSTISYHWTKDGQKISQGLSYLLITSVNPEDRGGYVCVATDGFTTASSDQALVTIEGNH